MQFSGIKVTCPAAALFNFATQIVDIYEECKIVNRFQLLFNTYYVEDSDDEMIIKPQEKKSRAGNGLSDRKLPKLYLNLAVEFASFI